MAGTSGHTSLIKGSQTSLRILQLLDELDGAGVTELANELDLSKGTIHPHLNTLRTEGFIVRDGDEYAVCLECLNIGIKARNRTDIYRAGVEEVKQLAEETGEYAHLMIEQNGWGYIVHYEKGGKASTTTSRVGKPLYLHCTSGGKAMQALMPRERVEKIVDKRGLPKKTGNTITDREELFAVLEEIRDRHVAFDTQEQLHGARSVGAAVQSPNDEILGAVTISGPASRLKGDRFESELPEKIRSAANIIEMEIEVNRLEE